MLAPRLLGKIENSSKLSTSKNRVWLSPTKKGFSAFKNTYDGDWREKLEVGGEKWRLRKWRLMTQEPRRIFQLSAFQPGEKTVGWCVVWVWQICGCDDTCVCCGLGVRGKICFTAHHCVVRVKISQGKVSSSVSLDVWWLMCSIAMGDVRTSEWLLKDFIYLFIFIFEKSQLISFPRCVIPNYL